MPQTGYACKECGSPARVVEGGEILRSCGHSGTVLARMSVTDMVRISDARMSGTAYGAGSMAHGNLFERTLHKLLKSLGKVK